MTFAHPVTGRASSSPALATLRLLSRDPGVLLACVTLAVEVRTIVRLRRILAVRAEFDRIIAAQ